MCDLVIDALRRLQAARGYLSRPALEALSAETGVPLDELYGVASFYPHFRFSPKLGPELKICRDLPCRLAGAAQLLAECRAAARTGAPGRDREASEPGSSRSGDGGAGGPQTAGGGSRPVAVTAVSCLGLCDTPPAVAIDDATYTGVEPTGGEALVAALAAGRPVPVRAAAPPPLSFAGAADPAAHHFGVLRRLLAVAPAARGEVIATLKAAGLRGLGGAGFPTATKWEIVAAAPGDRKYAICNADESEPGTFKDRVLLEGAPHLVLEGLLIAAVVVGAAEAIVYLRHEYRRAHAALERVVHRLEALGLVGEGSPAGVRLRVFESPGGYICGEETALLEALEGRRAEPRNKPPYPGTRGLYGRPTVINNVETLAFVPPILARGAAWYRGAGANGAPGRKLLALSGDVARPGVYEVPLGITARELIERHGGGVAGGRRLKAFSPGGPSSGFLPAALADVPLDFAPLAKVGSMLGSGAVIVLAEGRCLLDAARSYVEFFEAESCGKCVPCRVGTQKLAARLGEWAAGTAPGGRGAPGGPRSAPPALTARATAPAAAPSEATPSVRSAATGPSAPAAAALAAERARLDDLALTMGQASICGLGQVAALPATSLLAHFRDEVEAHLVEGRCPEGVCDGSRR